MQNSNSKDGTYVPTSIIADVTSSSQTIAKPNVSGSFFGLYSIDAELLFVHATREGAKKHQYEYEKAHGMGFYVEPVLVLD